MKPEFVCSGQTKPKVYAMYNSHSSETSTLRVTNFLKTDPWYQNLFSKCTLDLISWQYWKSKRFYFTKMRDLSPFKIRCTMYITNGCISYTAAPPIVMVCRSDCTLFPAVWNANLGYTCQAVPASSKAQMVNSLLNSLSTGRDCSCLERKKH